MSLQVNDRIELIDSPNEDVVPNGAKGKIISTDCKGFVEAASGVNDSDYWVIFDDYNAESWDGPNGNENEPDNSPDPRAFDLRDHEVRKVD